MSNPQICPISKNEMSKVFSQTILGKYDIEYYYCEECGLLKTEKPYWLDEAYKNAIADTDTGILSRNIHICSRLEPILQFMFKGKGQFLDLAGGYGILTRMLRDKGFNCYTIDKYCKNIFASLFEPFDGFKADMLFAFEVLEHIENPLTFIDENFRKYSCNTLLFSTQTFNKIPERNWPFYSFETGQHITFYEPRSLAYLAKILNKKYYMISYDLHCITDGEISPIARLLLFNKFCWRFYAFYVHLKRRRITLTGKDYNFAKEIISKNSH